MTQIAYAKKWLARARPNSINKPPLIKTNGECANTTSWLDIFGKSLAILAFTMTLIGYGTVLGLGDFFGMSHTSLFTGASDLIATSWMGILVFFDGLALLELSAIFLKDIQIYVAFAMVATTIISVFLYRKQASEKSLQTNAKVKIRRWYNQQDKQTQFSYFLILWVWLAKPIIIFSGLVIVGVLCFILIFPLIGFEAARTYAWKYIIQPETCTQSVARQDLIKIIKNKKNASSQSNETSVAYTAHCVSVESTDPSKPFRRNGRIVLATSQYAFLYYPTTGHSERISLEGKTLSSSNTDQLPPLGSIK
jgi:hypothetical protein